MTIQNSPRLSAGMRTYIGAKRRSPTLFEPIGQAIESVAEHRQTILCVDILYYLLNKLVRFVSVAFWRIFAAHLGRRRYWFAKEETIWEFMVHNRPSLLELCPMRPMVGPH